MNILTADISESCSAGKILQVLNSGSPKLLGHAYAPLLLDESMITGPNAHHRCIVTEVTKPSLSQWKEANNIWKFPVNVAGTIVAQDSIKYVGTTISDFSEALFKDEPRKESYTPIILLPPEYIFHEPITQAVDVWILGHLLYQVLGES